MEESSEDSRTERMTTSSSAGHRRSSEAAQDDSVLFYYRTLQWLEAEVEQHTTRLHALTSLDSETEDNLTPNRTQELQEKLTKLTTDRNVLRSLLESVQLGGRMIEVMFQQRDETNSKLQTSVTELVERTMSSVSDILRIHKENWTLQSSLVNLKEECLVLRQEIRELMHKLKQSQDKKETQMSTQNKGLEFKRAQTECHSLTGNIEIAQNVLQGLIFGSGLNWAEDKKLCDLVLSLGQPVEELLKEPVTESETLTDEEQPSQLC